jgi:hypothetical protein
MNCIEADTKMDEELTNLQSIKLALDLQNELNKAVNETTKMLIEAIKKIYTELEMIKKRKC